MFLSPKHELNDGVLKHTISLGIFSSHYIKSLIFFILMWTLLLLLWFKEDFFSKQMKKINLSW